MAAPMPSTHSPPLKQEVLVQKSRSLSQLSPENPATQVQIVVAAMPSVQVPLFIHGELSHSSISTEQSELVQPTTQMHVKVEFPSMHSLAP